MECFFINIESQTDRSEFLRGNFATHKIAGWYLNRINAVDGRALAAHPVAGVIREAEKGCFLSHRRAVEESLHAPGHALILEDDALFGPNSCRSIEAAAASLPEDGWDLLYTDLSIYHAPLMAGMLHMRRELISGGGQSLMINLKDITYCGATGYVVNQHFKQRLLELLGMDSLDRPYDVYLYELVKQDRIRASAIFPFPTSLSHFADQSQIQMPDSAATSYVFNAFRRFIWLDRDLENATASLGALPGDFMDPEAAAFSRIIGPAFSERIVHG